MQKIVSKDPDNYSMVLSWRLKDKKTGQVSKTFQKSFPYGRINKVAKECELKIDESKFTNLYASNIEKSDILSLNLDNNYFWIDNLISPFSLSKIGVSKELFILNEWVSEL